MKKKRISTVIVVLILLAGLSLLLYPTVSNHWNALHQSNAIAAYQDEIAGMDQEHYEQILADAASYNQAHSTQEAHDLTAEQKKNYQSLLNTGGTGIMTYIQIPALDVSIPVYHGTDNGVLQVAVGHLDWTSLPVGGVGTHCVLSGHRGMPGAVLFTHLDRLVVGDCFTLCTLNETLTYEVDRISVVKPSETDALAIEPGKDLCTLLTCTPYGVNSHRLLVRGHRVQNAEEKPIRVIADARQIEPLLTAVFAAALPLFALLLCLFIPGGKRTGRKKKEEN